MSTQKRFTCKINESDGHLVDVWYDNGKPIYTASKVCDLLNALHEENVKLKNSLKEFEVFESNRIKGAVVTNDNYSVTLYSNNEAYMVCNMLNRFIRSVKNGNKD